MRYSVVMVAALGVASGAGGVVLGAPAHAGAFTWDPSQAMPALTGGSAAFTADEVSIIIG